jgi:hypothetical protein
MKETLRTYNSQFTYAPALINEHLIAKNFKQIVFCGMGGSHLSADLLKVIEPGIDMFIRIMIYLLLQKFFWNHLY